MSVFGEYLNELLKRHRVTKSQLARTLKLKHQSYIGLIIRGGHTPTFLRLEQISRALNLTPDEKKRLFDLGIEDRTPPQLKKYQDLLLTGAPILGIITNPFDILALPKTSSSYSWHAIKLTECIIFVISGDFFSPLFKDHQQILTLEATDPHELRANDYLFIQFRCTKSNYGASVSEFKRQNSRGPLIITKIGEEYLFGIVKSYNDRSERIILTGHKDPNSEISIAHSDIVKMMRVVGVLFDRLPKISMDKFRKK